MHSCSGSWALNRNSWTSGIGSGEPACPVHTYGSFHWPLTREYAWHVPSTANRRFVRACSNRPSMPENFPVPPMKLPVPRPRSPASEVEKRARPVVPPDEVQHDLIADIRILLLSTHSFWRISVRFELTLAVLHDCLVGPQLQALLLLTGTCSGEAFSTPGVPRLPRRHTLDAPRRAEPR